MFLICFLYTYRHICCRTITRAFALNAGHWIGLNDQANENDFRWVNGNQANSDDDSLWYPTYPRNNGGSDDCCRAYFSDTRFYAYRAWNVRCSSPLQSICEKLV